MDNLIDVVFGTSNALGNPFARATLWAVAIPRLTFRPVRKRRQKIRVLVSVGPRTAHLGPGRDSSTSTSSPTRTVTPGFSGIRFSPNSTAFAVWP